MKHLLPNSLAPLIVSSTLSVGSFIIVESALSFLGVGIQPPTPSWATCYRVLQSMAGSSTTSIHSMNTPYLVLFPGTTILLTVLSITLSVKPHSETR